MQLEEMIYSLICSCDGITAREISKQIKVSKTEINRHLYGSPYIKELCYHDDAYRWYGMIGQKVPHRGLEEFSGYYGYVKEFLDLDYSEFNARLQKGCRNIGRNLNDTRGLFHSFEDTYNTMQNLFADLYRQSKDLGEWKDWEMCFELRIKRARTIRIYADVILLTEKKAFSLEFKMNDKILEEDLVQAAKYCPYLEILFGPNIDVIGALVLTRAENLYEEMELSENGALVPVCSGDRLHELVRLWR